jgi:hypothetical protein
VQRYHISRESDKYIGCVSPTGYYVPFLFPWIRNLFVYSEIDECFLDCFPFDASTIDYIYKSKEMMEDHFISQIKHQIC